MYRSTTRWTTAVAAAALMALPVAAAAQSTGTMPQQPPAQTQPPTTQPPTTQPPPMQPPPTMQPTQTSTSQTSQTTSGQVDASAAKQRLSEARDTLSQLAAMPEAAKLQGEARTQVSQLISNFNELITTQSNWRAAYGKVDANLTTLLGPDSGAAPSATSGAVGTSGTAGTAATGTSGTAAGTASAPENAAVTLDPAIRAKLVSFRSQLKQFEQAAGSGQAGESTSSAPAPAAAAASTTNPANPASSANPTNPDPASAAPPSQPPTTAGATGTSGSSSSAAASMDKADQEKAAEQVGHAEADKHLDAISAILNASKTGALTRAQTTELKKHVEELRKLLQSR